MSYTVKNFIHNVNQAIAGVDINIDTRPEIMARWKYPLKAEALGIDSFFTPIIATGGGHGSPLFDISTLAGSSLIKWCRDLPDDRAVALLIRERNCPFPLEDSNGPKSPEALQLAVNNAPRIDYVFMDLERNSGSEWVEKNIKEVHRIVRASSNPAARNARLGCYDFAGYSYDVSNVYPAKRYVNTLWDPVDPVKLYNDYLDISMPVCYPYQVYAAHTNKNIQTAGDVSPNKRHALLWAAVARFELARTNLRAGRIIIPWVAPFIPYNGDNHLYDAEEPSDEDQAALLVHLLMRGARSLFAFDHADSNYKHIVRNVVTAFRSLGGFVSYRGGELEKSSGIITSVSNINGEVFKFISNFSNKMINTDNVIVSPGAHKFMRVVDVP